MSSADEITRLFRVRKTSLEMLRDRGYMVGDYELDMKKEDFVQRFGKPPMNREDLLVIVHMPNDSSDKICVFFVEEQVGVHQVKTYFDRMKADSIPRAILVGKNGITPVADAYMHKEIRQNHGKFRLEFFEEAPLLFNVSKHDMVPPHRILTDEEKKAVLEKFSVNETQIPQILMSDPVARYYGGVSGQVFEITRPSETAGQAVVYRHVKY